MQLLTNGGMRGLGRRIDKDVKDQRYLLRRLPPMQQRIERVNLAWPLGSDPLDQGAEGTCVGHGWKHFLMCPPIVQPGPAATRIYNAACGLDPFPENDNLDPSYGTTVRAAAQALQTMGFLSVYNWAFDADTVLDWLVIGGPMVLGINWYAGMAETDRDGFIHDTGRIVGGHCVAVNEINVDQKWVGGPNSWGPGWGLGGYWRMSWDMLDRLIRQDGEACTASEQQIPLLRLLQKAV